MQFSGPEETKGNRGKTKHTGMMDRGFTIQRQAMTAMGKKKSIEKVLRNDELKMDDLS
jgi:hypothetical protein